MRYGRSASQHRMHMWSAVPLTLLAATVTRLVNSGCTAHRSPRFVVR
jgi:hypothetical protein